MRAKVLLFFLSAASSFAVPQEDPANKLSAFLGKWQTEGQLTGSDTKIQTTLDCRWSPQRAYLVCEQLIHMGSVDHRQLTIYSYNARDNDYTYTTLADPGSRPSSGRVEIKGNIWTYASSFEANGKVVHIRTTNEFTDVKTEVFKAESSDDGGATWKTTISGTAHKTGD